MKAVARRLDVLTPRASSRTLPRPAPAPVHEHEFEAARGLPEPLPDGEVQLWQGSPDARLLARQALHLDLVAGYFGVLLVWRAVSSVADGATAAQTVWAMASLLPIMLLACGLLAGMAWLMARTTVYTLTDRRVVMRVGIVLSITFNLPFSRIAGASWRARGRGGDIVLSLAGADRIAYLHLWPHARPWRLRQTQPMLRALADAPAVAAVLAAALRQAETAGQALPLRAVSTADSACLTASAGSPGSAGRPGDADGRGEPAGPGTGVLPQAA